MSGICFGVANFFSAKLSELGPSAFWAMWLGVLLPPVIYHGFGLIMTLYQGSTYFGKESSMYYVKKGEEFEF